MHTYRCSFSFSTDDLILRHFAELDVLLVVERNFHVESIQAPQCGHRFAPRRTGKQQFARPVRFQMDEVIVVGGERIHFRPRMEIKYMDVSVVFSYYYSSITRLKKNQK